MFYGSKNCYELVYEGDYYIIYEMCVYSLKLMAYVSKRIFCSMWETLKLKLYIIVYVHKRILLYKVRDVKIVYKF